MRVAILRCAALPSFVTWEIPDTDALFEDDRLLIAGFAEQGVAAEATVWRDPDIDWSRFDVALIRSAWDYIDARAEFLEVLSAIAASPCRLFNALETVRWNSDKHYLLDLARWGVPVVPTFRASTAEAGELSRRFADRGWDAAVLKPAIGAGGAGVHRIAANDIDGMLATLAVARPQDHWLVQPLVDSVISEGEWSYFFFNGELSHVLLKRPAAGDYRAHGIYGGTIAAAEPRAGDLGRARSIVAKLPFDLLYARLDLVRVNGGLVVMELELVEPMMYFGLAPAAVARFVRATLARCDRKR